MDCTVSTHRRGGPLWSLLLRAVTGRDVRGEDAATSIKNVCSTSTWNREIELAWGISVACTVFSQLQSLPLAVGKHVLSPPVHRSSSTHDVFNCLHVPSCQFLLLSRWLLSKERHGAVYRWRYAAAGSARAACHGSQRGTLHIACYQT
jgi:hypothetical protein